MYQRKQWTAEQLSKMNEESFLVEMLDMFAYSPSNADASSTEQIQSKLEAVEAALKARLESTRSS